MLNFLARNLDSLLATYGYLAVFVFVGVESIGIPVPGETMLVTAAIYAGTTGRLSIFWVIVASAAGAIVGDNIGYLIGRTGGYRLVKRYGRYIRLGKGRVCPWPDLFGQNRVQGGVFRGVLSGARIFPAFLARG